MHSNIIAVLLLVVFTFLSCKSDPSVSTEKSSNTSNKMEVEKSNVVETKKANTKMAKSIDFDKMKAQYKDDPAMLKKIEEKERLNKEESNVVKKVNGIPDPCSFVDAKYLAKKLSASEGHVTQKAGKLVPGAEKHSRSCFWKWNNGGLMIQISTNPMPEEVPNYISKVLNSKKSFGDSNPDSESNSKFVNFSGPGTINIKHQDSGRYYVSKGDDFLIMVMFNGKKKNYDKVVNEIASKIMKEFN